jgi:hypothetical protein
MIPNNNLSPLPFYDSVERQNHRKDYAFGEVFCLGTPDRKILPFQIIREHRTNQIVYAKLRKKDGTEFLDVLNELSATGLLVNQYTASGYDVIVYPGILPMAITTPEGEYYLHLSDGVQNWFSDVFTIVYNLSEYLKIEYSDADSLVFDNGLIDYSGTFKFHIYLCTQVGKPEYPFTEQLEERDGQSFIEKQISEKTYKFTFLAPEYLCDAMRIIRMSDYVTIFTKGNEYDVDTFLITPKWEEQGDLASVEAEFQCNTIVKKIGMGYTPADNGDFNNDYNNDYKNS